MSFFDDASLAFLPSGGAGKDGKAYSIKPTDGTGDFTFSRGSNLTATRVGPTGLIEKGRENLLLQSNAFSTSPWITTNSSVTSGQSGYDGSTDAWAIDKPSGSSLFLSVNTTTTSVCTLSIYVKINPNNGILLATDLAAGYAAFNISDSNQTTPTELQGIDVKQEYVGNNFYRLSITSNGASYVRFYNRIADGTAFDSGTSTHIIQDAQLELGLAATDYIESGASTGKAGLLENEPRFDYSGGATCPSLLLEPSRTNLIPYSEYYNGSGYLLETNATLDSTLYESPEGLNNAYKLNLPSTLSRITHVGLYTGAHSFSVWMRADTIGTISLRCATGNPAVSEQKNVTTEWQRFDITATDGNFWQVIRNSGDTLSSVYIYGHQIEAGSYPTSYIPNHSGGSATRTKDEGETSTIADVNEGVIFFEGFVDKNENTIKLIELHDGTANNRIFVYYRDSTGLQPRLYAFAVNGGTQVYGYAYDIPSGRGEVSHKVAVRFADNNFAMFYNGTQVHTQTSGIVSTNAKNQISFASYLGALNFSGKVKQLLVFPEALSDADCITLTT